MQEGVLVLIKDKTRSRYLGGHMNYLADSTATMDNSSGENVNL